MVDQAEFTERGPYEKGFAAVFAREIAPKLGDLEDERLELFNQRGVRLLVTIAATVLCAIIAAGDRRKRGLRIL